MCSRSTLTHQYIKVASETNAPQGIVLFRSEAYCIPWIRTNKEMLTNKTGKVKEKARNENKCKTQTDSHKKRIEILHNTRTGNESETQFDDVKIHNSSHMEIRETLLRNKISTVFYCMLTSCTDTLRLDWKTGTCLKTPPEFRKVVAGLKSKYHLTKPITATNVELSCLNSSLCESKVSTKYGSCRTVSNLYLRETSHSFRTLFRRTWRAWPKEK